jgi:hypothetical protein
MDEILDFDIYEDLGGGPSPVPQAVKDALECAHERADAGTTGKTGAASEARPMASAAQLAVPSGNPLQDRPETLPARTVDAGPLSAVLSFQESEMRQMKTRIAQLKQELGEQEARLLVANAQASGNDGLSLSSDSSIAQNSWHPRTDPVSCQVVKRVRYAHACASNAFH